MTKLPTCEDLYNEDGYKSVYREADDSWRHGSYVTEVFERESDNTFWLVKYRLSTDGETHELRDDGGVFYPRFAFILKNHPAAVVVACES